MLGHLQNFEWRSPVSTKRLAPAANDNGDALQVRVEGLDSTPLFVTELEIFDVLISNIAELTAANENARAPEEKKK